MLKQLSLLFLVGTLTSCSSYLLKNPEYATDIPEQTAVLPGVSNFRNVGGITNTEGKTLKAGLIYRSANLTGLKSRNFLAFKELKIKKVIDLRTDGEIAKAPDRIPPGVTYVHLPAFIDKGDEFSRGRKMVLKGQITSAEAEKRMLDFYKDYVTEKPEVVRNIVHQVLDSEAPVLYHCTAGKDRTGIVTALVLKVLKFDDEHIFNDYLYSNDLRKELVYKRLRLAKKAQTVYRKMDIAVLEKLSWIESDYLNATFAEIDLKYGSIDNYIHDVLQINEAQRQAYIDKFME